MQAERDALVRVVFPALRERLERHRIYLNEVDLRWGVTREQAENDEALELCLQQVDECRPFFIGMLGQRYGWVPTRLRPEATRRYPWLAGLAERSVTELEIEHGALRPSSMPVHAFFCLRDATLGGQIPTAARNLYLEQDAGRAAQLKDLVARIRARGFPLLDGYRCRWTADERDPLLGSVILEDDFAQWLERELWQAMRLHLDLPEDDSLAAQDLPAAGEREQLDAEAEDYERFMAARTRLYVGRDDIQQRLLQYISGNEATPLLLVGAPGAGKSAALARLVLEAQQHGQLVVPHFVGASSRSTSLRLMLRRFCLIWQAELNLTDDVPRLTTELVPYFRALLARAPEEWRILLVVDAVDQLEASDHAHDMHWLPDALPASVKIVLSHAETDRSPALARLRKRGLPELHLPELTDHERHDLIRAIPALWAKTLDTRQATALLRNVETVNPLYLLVAIEELRGFGSYEELSQRIAELPVGENALPAIFRQVLQRVERDFPRELVIALLSHLGASRRGLTELELRQTLAGAQKSGDLFVVLRQLRPYLSRRGALIGFFHNGLTRAVRERYLGTSEARRAAHARLADHFGVQPDWQDSVAGLRAPNTRKADELPWQHAQAAQLDPLSRLLKTPSFLEAKVEAGLIFDLLLDYDLARQQLSPGPSATVLQLLAEAMRMNAAFVARHPGALFQSVWNTAYWYDAPEAEQHLVRATLRPVQPPAEPEGERLSDLLVRWRADRSGRGPSLWLRGLRPPFERLATGGDLVIRTRSDRLFAVAFSPDGLCIACAGRDQTIRIYDKADGAELVCCEGHTGAVNTIAFAPSGQQLLSGSDDGHVCCWSALTGDLLWSSGSLERNDGFAVAEPGLTMGAIVMRSLAVLGEGREWSNRTARITVTACSSRRVAVAVCGNLFLLDLDDGTLCGHRRLQGALIDSLAWSHDELLLAVGISDGTARVFRAADLEQMAFLPGHANMPGISVTAIALSPCSRFVATGDLQGQVRGWRASDSKLLWQAVGAVSSGKKTTPVTVSSLAFSKDHRWLVAGTADGRVHVHDAESGVEQRWLELHGGWVRGVACSPVEMLAASCGDDRTLRLFSLLGAAQPPELDGHAGIVGRIRYSNDGKLLASATTRGDIIVWNTNPLAIRTRIADPKVHTGGVAFAPDGRRLATGSNSCEVRIWSTDTGEELAHFSGNGRSAATCIEWSPQGSLLATGAHDTVVWVQDAESGRGVVCVEGYEAQLLAVAALLPDQIVTGSNTGQLCVWGAQTGSLVRELVGHEGPVTSCLALATTGRLLSGSNDGTLRLWDAASGRQLCSRSGFKRVHALACSANGERIFALEPGALHCLRGEALEPVFSFREDRLASEVHYLQRRALVVVALGNEMLRLHPDGREEDRVSVGDSAHRIVSMAWSADEEHVYVLTSEPRSLLLHYSSKQELSNWQLPAPAQEHRLDPSGRRLAYRFGSSLLIWEVDTGATAHIDTGPSTVNAFAFSTDGLRLFAATADNALTLWNVTSGACLSTAQGPEKPPAGVRLEFPYSRQVAAERGPAGELLDAATGALLIRVRSLGKAQMALPFSPDGNYLACATQGHAVLIMDLRARQVCARLIGHRALVNAIAFSEDGRRIASGSRDKTVRLWDVASGECLHVYDGRGDVRAIANGAPRYPYFALVRSATETEIVSADTGETVAWFPAPMLPVVTNPSSGEEWCGVEYTKQFFLRLER